MLTQHPVFFASFTVVMLTNCESTEFCVVCGLSFDGRHASRLVIACTLILGKYVFSYYFKSLSNSTGLIVVSSIPSACNEYRACLLVA